MKIVVKDSYLSTRPKQVEGKVVPKYAFHTVKPKYGGVLLYSGTQSNVLKRDERCGVHVQRQTDNKVLKQEGVVTPIPNLVIGATIGVVAVSTSPGYCPTNDRIYYQTVTGGTFFTINPATNTVEASFSGGVGGSVLSEMVYCPLNNCLYVTHGSVSPSRISVINCTSNTVSSITDSVNIFGAVGVEYCPSTQKVYHGNFNFNSLNYSFVTVIDPFTNTVSGIIPFPSGGRCFDVVYCPSNDRLYCADISLGIIRVINPQTNTIVANIPLDSQSSTPRAMEYCPLTDEILVVCSGTVDRNIYAIAPHTNTIRDKRDITFSDALRSALAVEYNPAHGRVNVSHNYSSGLFAWSSIDPYSLVVERFVPISPQTNPTKFCYCPSNQKMYTSQNFSFVTVLDYTY